MVGIYVPKVRYGEEMEISTNKLARFFLSFNPLQPR